MKLKYEKALEIINILSKNQPFVADFYDELTNKMPNNVFSNFVNTKKSDWIIKNNAAWKTSHSENKHQNFVLYKDNHFTDSNGEMYGAYKKLTVTKHSKNNYSLQIEELVKYTMTPDKKAKNTFSAFVSKDKEKTKITIKTIQNFSNSLWNKNIKNLNGYKATIKNLKQTNSREF